jgi:hypothetical protein
MATKRATKPRTKVCEICGCVVSLRGYNGHVRFAHGELPAEAPPNRRLEDVLLRIEKLLGNLPDSVPVAANAFAGYVCPKCGDLVIVEWTPPGIMRLKCQRCWEAG